MTLEVSIILSLTLKGVDQLRCLKIRPFKTGELTTHILSSCFESESLHQHEANSNLLLANAEVAASPPAPQAGGDVICVTLHSLLYNRKHTQKGVSLQSVMCPVLPITAKPAGFR